MLLSENVKFRLLMYFAARNENMVQDEAKNKR